MNEKKIRHLIHNTKYLILNTRLLPGLTLVELVTSAAILGVLSLMIGSVYLAHFRLFSSQSASIDTSAQNKIAIEEISNQIRESVGVTNCPASGHYTCPSGTNNTGAILVIALWKLESGVPTGPGTDPLTLDYIVYKLNGTNFVKSVYPASGSSRQPLTNKILASNVTNLAFTYNTTDVTVTLTTQPKNSKETPFTQTVKVYLRNR